jgi:hypothetical protein
MKIRLFQELPALNEEFGHVICGLASQVLKMERCGRSYWSSPSSGKSA